MSLRRCSRSIRELNRSGGSSSSTSRKGQMQNRSGSADGSTVIRCRTTACGSADLHVQTSHAFHRSRFRELPMAATVPGEDFAAQVEVASGPIGFRADVVDQLEFENHPLVVRHRCYFTQPHAVGEADDAQRPGEPACQGRSPKGGSSNSIRPNRGARQNTITATTKALSVSAPSATRTPGRWPPRRLRAGDRLPDGLLVDFTLTRSRIATAARGSART